MVSVKRLELSSAGLKGPCCSIQLHTHDLVRTPRIELGFDALQAPAMTNFARTGWRNVRDSDSRNITSSCFQDKCLKPLGYASIMEEGERLELSDRFTPTYGFRNRCITIL